VVEQQGTASAKELAWGTFEAVERHIGARRLFDDLTVLVVRRLPPLPAIP
jgi:serine phosphatase RsbU (regulator of sigma subunit)